MFGWPMLVQLKLERDPDLFLDPISGGPAPKDCCSLLLPLSINRIKLVVQTDYLVDGGYMSFPILFIKDDGLIFNQKYHLKVRQFNVSAEAFEFHRFLSGQLEIEGNIFDPPTAEIMGNVINPDNPEEVVVGYFGAYHVSVKSILITPEDIEEKQRVRVFRDDCRTLLGATDRTNLYL